MTEIQKPEDFQTPRHKNPFQKFINLLMKAMAAGRGLIQKMSQTSNGQSPLRKVLSGIESLESKIPVAMQSYYRLYKGRWIVLGLTAVILLSGVRGFLGGKKEGGPGQTAF